MSDPSTWAERFDAVVAEALKHPSRAPPFLSAHGFRVDDVQPGVLIASLPVKPDLMSPMGAMHGGALAAVVDHVCSTVVYPLIERGKWVATLETKLNFIEAVREGEIKATSRLLSLKSKIAVARVDVENAGRLVASAQGTLYIRER